MHRRDFEGDDEGDEDEGCSQGLMAEMGVEETGRTKRKYKRKRTEKCKVEQRRDFCDGRSEGDDREGQDEVL